MTDLRETSPFRKERARLFNGCSSSLGFRSHLDAASRAGPHGSSPLLTRIGLLGFRAARHLQLIASHRQWGHQFLAVTISAENRDDLPIALAGAFASILQESLDAV